MAHLWDEGEMFLDIIVSTCEKCDAVRTRQRIAGVDYINTGGMSVDMVGEVDTLGWDYQDVPSDCVAEAGA